MQAEKVIIKPIILTEKSATQKEEFNKYFFVVSMKSTKVDIRDAVEKLFDVQVKSISTMIVRGKTKRVGRLEMKRKNWKKAIVTLQENNTIDFFEGA